MSSCIVLKRQSPGTRGGIPETPQMEATGALITPPSSHLAQRTDGIEPRLHPHQRLRVDRQ